MDDLGVSLFLEKPILLGSCLNTGSQYMSWRLKRGSLHQNEQVIYQLLQSFCHAPKYYTRPYIYPLINWFCQKRPSSAPLINWNIFRQHHYISPNRLFVSLPSPQKGNLTQDFRTRRPKSYTYNQNVPVLAHGHNSTLGLPKKETGKKEDSPRCHDAQLNGPVCKGGFFYYEVFVKLFPLRSIYWNPNKNQAFRSG